MERDCGVERRAGYGDIRAKRSTESTPQSPHDFDGFLSGFVITISNVLERRARSRTMGRLWVMEDRESCTIRKNALYL